MKNRKCFGPKIIFLAGMLLFLTGCGAFGNVLVEKTEAVSMNKEESETAAEKTRDDENLTGDRIENVEEEPAAIGAVSMNKEESGTAAEKIRDDENLTGDPIENRIKNVEEESMTLEDFLENATDMQKIYTDILLNPESYAEYYAITEQIPSDSKWKLELADGTEPYCFALQDFNQDGREELLLGYGIRMGIPQILLNFLQYDAENHRVTDLDGERTYPLMDSLVFYENGYFTTQNEVSDLYTECWNLNDNPEHYLYGWERSAKFYDESGQMINADDYYKMIGENVLTVEWKERTEENIIEQIFHKNRQEPAEE